MSPTTTQIRPASPGTLRLRDAPPGLPDATLQPPTVAESGDPFAAARVLHLLARLERGVPIRVDDIVAALNSAHLDWLFDSRVVTDAILAVQSNWLADYRNATGIVLEDGPYGAALTIEDSSRVDPWIVRQVAREIAAGRDVLEAFSRLDRVAGDA